MKQKMIFGQSAPAPRTTILSAALIALACALPVGVLLWIVEWLWL
ncbi:hypothetical protein [Primorskyibacter sp. S187A]